MFRLARLLGVSSSLVLLTATAWAQLSVEQSLKDVYVATSTQLRPVDYGADPISVGPNVEEVAGDSFQAMAFAPPLLEGALSERSLVTVDGTKLRRFTNLKSGAVEAAWVDVSSKPSPGLKSVTAVAVSDTGTVLFSGYSNPKRVFELWAWNGQTGDDPTPITSGTPQLTDAVYIPSADVVSGSILGAYGNGGGLLAAAARQVLFFRPGNVAPAFQVLLDARNLPVKANTQLLSAELVRNSNKLLITTSERKLLVVSTSGSLIQSVDLNQLPLTACQTSKTQRLLVRLADSETVIVSDLCGRVLRYAYDDEAVSAPLSPTGSATTGPLVALAIGEGNEVICTDSAACQLSNAVTWIEDAQRESNPDGTLVVLEFNDLCDPRVNLGCLPLPPPPDPDYCESIANVLSFNSLLPTSVQAALKARDVCIKLPDYMYSANFSGRQSLAK